MRLSVCIGCVLRDAGRNREPYREGCDRITDEGTLSLTVWSLDPVATSRFRSVLTHGIDVLRLTRDLIDIPSVTGDEFHIGTSLSELLNRLGYHVELQDIAPERANIIATTEARPRVVLSTHMDTVPPFIASSEDDEFIFGRGACDAKGIIATQIAAAEKLRAEGFNEIGLLFTVDEEVTSAGAKGRE